MLRRSLCILALASPALAAPATPTEKHVMLDVPVAAAPVPALKHSLLPEMGEMNPGNTVPAFMKCFAEQTNFFFKKESVDERENYLKCPLSDIKPGSLKGYGGSGLRQADHAARLEYTDWNILPQMKQQGYALLLPEIQQMRTLAGALAVKTRGQIVDKDFDGAIHTLKTIFALARTMGEHPTIISGLVGAAIANIGLNVLEELIQQPGSPNLYWALATLPNPLVDLRKSASAERMITEASFGSYVDQKRIWTAEDVADAMKKATEIGFLIDLSAEDRKAGEAWLRDHVKDENWLKETRKTLVENGYPADRVDKYPPEQVVFSHLLRKSRIQHDESLKWIAIPYWQAVDALEELTKAPVDIEDKLTRSIVFGVARVRATHVRLEQRFALLRTVEAIRLEGAKNGGKLPEKLGDISVPIPADPVSGKSLEYKVNGMTATVKGEKAKVPTGAFTHSYEVQLRK